jgi:DNA polymerase-3 subunit beta
MSTTNLEIAITTWMDCDVIESGACCVPATLLAELVNSIPSGEVRISVTDQPANMHISSGRFEASVNCGDVSDFPPLPVVDQTIPARIALQEFRSAISQVVFAAASDESRPVLTGIKAEITGETFVLAAADGFRLAVHTGKLVAPVTEGIDVVIPARTLEEVARVAGDLRYAATEEIEISVSPAKSQVLLKMPNVEIVGQLTQGQFPDYKQLIPDSNDSVCKAVVNLDAFSRSSRTAAILARDSNGIVRLEFILGEDATGTLQISSSADEIGENNEAVDAEITGQSSRIAFSSRYLIDVLRNIPGTQVVIECISPSSPGVFRSEGDDSYVHVVMPMFVRW